MNKTKSDKIESVVNISGDRHPQSENYIKITAIICLTVLLCFTISIVFYYKNNGNQDIFNWFINVQIFLSGFLSAFGILGIKEIFNFLKKSI